MPPKKSAVKKGADDWEADLGESIDPTASAGAETAKPTEQAKDEDAGAKVDSAMGGGLLAALKKNKGKRAKKGRPVEDFVEGEDPTQVDGGTEGKASQQNSIDLAAKAPEEANLEEEEDVYSAPLRKPTGVKGGLLDRLAAAEEEAGTEEEGGEGGKMKTKKEKEKEKREREKMRKKEQVFFLSFSSFPVDVCGRRKRGADVDF